MRTIYWRLSGAWVDAPILGRPDVRAPSSQLADEDPETKKRTIHNYVVGLRLGAGLSLGAADVGIALGNPPGPQTTLIA
jgi:hypothetical protein